MRSSYKNIGDIIQLVDNRNKDLSITNLLGLSISKQFISSVANIVGTGMANYKIIKKNQFACSLMQVRRDKKIPVAILKDFDEAIISQAYPVFEIKDGNEVLPEYLMMWMSRSEFDREACFLAVGGVRGSLEWEDFCNMKLPVPSIEKQREIVKEYNTVVDRISLNEKLNQKLEETAQSIYKQWFVDFEFPDENGKPYKSSGGEMVFCEESGKEIPKNWKAGKIGDYSKVKSGFAFKSSWWEKSGVPVIKIGSISDNSIDYSGLDYVNKSRLDKALKSRVKEGGVVIAMTGATIGKIGIVPKLSETILVNQRVGLFNLGEAPLEKAPFLYLVLLEDFTQDEIKNVGGDSAQANISNIQIEDISIVLPNQNILNNFNKTLLPSFKVILIKINENNKLLKLKKLLLSKMAV